MTDEDKKPDPLDMESSSEASPEEAREAYEQPDVEVSRGVEPLPLEDVDFASLNLPDNTVEAEEEKTYEMEVDPESDYVKSLDNCPNCGKSMGKIGNLVCLNCGYSLKTMSVIEIEKGTVTEEELIDEKVISKPLSVRGRGNMILPAIVGGVSLLLLMIGYMFGSTGLLENVEQSKFKAFLAGFSWLLPLFGCGVAAMYTLGILLERKVGKAKRMLVRVAGIICTMRLVTFIDSPYAEFVIEVFLELCLAFGMALLFFKLTRRDAIMLVSLGFVNLGLFYVVIKLFSSMT